MGSLKRNTFRIKFQMYSDLVEKKLNDKQYIRGIYRKIYA